MKTGHIEIFVKDPLKSKVFYTEALKFELVEVQQDAFVWLKSGDVLVLLRPGRGLKAGTDEYALSDIGLVLYTDNLLKTAENLQSKGLEFKGTDGSEKCLTFTDPDGN